MGFAMCLLCSLLQEDIVGTGFGSASLNGSRSIQYEKLHLLTGLYCKVGRLQGIESRLTMLLYKLC